MNEDQLLSEQVGKADVGAFTPLIPAAEEHPVLISDAAPEQLELIEPTADTTAAVQPAPGDVSSLAGATLGPNPSGEVIDPAYLPDPEMGLIPAYLEGDTHEAMVAMSPGLFKDKVFSPESENDPTQEQLDRHDDQFLAPPMSILLTDVERQARLEKAIQAARKDIDGTKSLVYDYGPLAELQQRLEKIALGGTPPFAQFVADAIRHEMASTYEQMADDFARKTKPEEARQVMKQSIGTAMSSIEARVLTLQGAVGALGFDAVPALTPVSEAMVKESKKFDPIPAGKMAPRPSLSGTVLGALSKRFQFKPAPGTALTGNLRKLREVQIAEALYGLKDVAEEMRSRAGNREWEQTEGKLAVRAARELMGRVKTLTRGVETQLNAGKVKSVLEGAHEEMKDAIDRTGESDFGSDVKNIAKDIADFVENFMKALKRLFKSGNDSESSKAIRPN